MAPAPRPIEEAPLAGRRLLGILLAQRRAELGYTHRPAFTRARLPLTDSGNPNTRLVADIEEAYRKNFPESRLRQLAQAYLVTYRSLTDVAHLRHNALVPVSPAVPPADGDAGAGAGPYADRIWERLRELAGKGVMDPDGAQVFGKGSPDARTWDAISERWDVPRRVRMIADLQYMDDQPGRRRDGTEG
jgi:hypothetical protein